MHPLLDNGSCAINLRVIGLIWPSNLITSCFYKMNLVVFHLKTWIKLSYSHSASRKPPTMDRLFKSYGEHRCSLTHRSFSRKVRRLEWVIWIRLFWKLEKRENLASIFTQTEINLIRGWLLIIKLSAKKRPNLWGIIWTVIRFLIFPW